MTYLVAFDGSDLSVAALERAVVYADAMDTDCVATTVVPGDAGYALNHGWVDDRADFDQDAVADALRTQVASVAPGVRFRPEPVGSFAGAHTITHRIREVAIDEGATVLFLGSENAGQIVTPMTSVARNLSTGANYDVHIVRSTER